MLDQLIAEGEALDSETQDRAMGMGKMISGENFEKWVSKCILYLEKNHSKSSITAKAIDINKRLAPNSYSNYQFFLGALKGIKEME